MKKLRLNDHREMEKVGLMFAGLLLISVLLSNPTALVAGSGAMDNAVKLALENDGVMDFLIKNPDFHILFEEITPEKKEALEHEYPNTYSYLPDKPLHQLIFDSGNNALLIILDDEIVYKIVEVNMGGLP